MHDVDDILQTRNSTHGDWAAQAQLSEVLWQNILMGIAQTNDGQITLTPSQSQSLHMICTKMSRIACGNPNEPDHWDDIAGYATLAAREVRREKVERDRAEMQLKEEGRLARTDR